jgi:hypothetical protein
LQNIGFRFDGVAKKPFDHPKKLFQQPSRSHLANKVFPNGFGLMDTVEPGMIPSDYVG